MIKVPKESKQSEAKVIMQLLRDNLRYGDAVCYGALIRPGRLLDDISVVVNGYKPMHLTLVESSNIEVGHTDNIVDFCSEPARDAAVNYLEESFDFVIVDCPKYGVYSSMSSWWPLLRRNGIICGVWFNYKSVKHSIFKCARGNDVYKIDCGSGIWAIRKEQL